VASKIPLRKSTGSPSLSEPTASEMAVSPSDVTTAIIWDRTVSTASRATRERHVAGEASRHTVAYNGAPVTGSEPTAPRAASVTLARLDIVVPGPNPLSVLRITAPPPGGDAGVVAALISAIAEARVQGSVETRNREARNPPSWTSSSNAPRTGVSSTRSAAEARSAESCAKVARVANALSLMGTPSASSEASPEARVTPTVPSKSGITTDPREPVTV
jgi:hypothetical protein